MKPFLDECSYCKDVNCEGPLRSSQLVTVSRQWQNKSVNRPDLRFLTFTHTHTHKHAQTHTHTQGTCCRTLCRHFHNKAIYSLFWVSETDIKQASLYPLIWMLPSGYTHTHTHIRISAFHIAPRGKTHNTLQCSVVLPPPSKCSNADKNLIPDLLL